MPFYDFKCKKCDFEYEARSAIDPSGKYKNVKCPECKSSKKQQIIKGCSFNFTNPIGTDRWTSEEGGHQYRYDYNKPFVRKQREQAEKNSHMGSTPYENIDDVSSGKYFGEVR